MTVAGYLSIFQLWHNLQVHLGVCIGCGEKFKTKNELTDHMHEAGHTNTIPDISVWDQPQ